MTNLTVKMDEALLNETETLLGELQIERDDYITQAIVLLNKLQKRKILGRQMAIESKMVQAESMKVLAEFECLNDDSTAI